MENGLRRFADFAIRVILLKVLSPDVTVDKCHPKRQMSALKGHQRFLNSILCWYNSTKYLSQQMHHQNMPKGTVDQKQTLEPKIFDLTTYAIYTK
jgi:hypothetical protein